MGDLSAEPSMEDILASIKRVIREGEPQTAPRRMSPRPGPEAVAAREEDEVLELSQPIPTAPASTPAPAAAPAPLAEAATDPTPAPRPAAATTVAPARPATEPAPGVSPATAEAARGALGQLSRLVVKPEAGGDGTLEGLVKDLLRPMVSEWLDANLPRLVEEMVAREIAKITDGVR